MNKRQITLCALVIWMTVGALAGDAGGRQKSRRKQKPTEVVKTTTLTRPRAAEIIKAYPAFKSTYNSNKIPVGRVWYDHRIIKDPLFNELANLEEQRLLTISETGKFYTSVWKEYLVELTPRGEAEVKTWIKTSEKPKELAQLVPDSPDATVFRIALATKELIEVTGIASDPSGKVARVEFTWKWTPTAQADLLPERVPSDEPREAALMFQLYDDGWRIVPQGGEPF
jgi:hypothetical protein